MYGLPWITSFWSRMRRFANDFHEWCCHKWKSLANPFTSGPKIVIHCKPHIFLTRYAMEHSNPPKKSSITHFVIALLLGLHSLSRRTSYRKISWSLEVARFGFKLFQSLWTLTGRCLSNFKAIRSLWHPISQLREFTIFGGKTSYRLVNRDPGVESVRQWRSLLT